MQIVIRAFGLTLFEMLLMETAVGLPSVMVSEVSSIPVYVAEDETEEEEEESLRLGFQQKNGK